MKKVVILLVELEKEVPDLEDLIAQRAYTVMGRVANVEVVRQIPTSLTVELAESLLNQELIK